jgi:putative transposase
VKGNFCILSFRKLPNNMSVRRMKNYDYGAKGEFYITICTYQMKHYFGKVIESENSHLDAAAQTGHCPSENRPNDSFIETGNGPSVLLSEIGLKAKEFWMEIPKHYSFVILDEFIIMPNHIHGILLMNKPPKDKWEPNQFGIQSGNLGAIIRGFKSSLKRYANENNIEFQWKERFRDDLIRDQSDLERVRHYILQNPSKWLEKKKNNP